MKGQIPWNKGKTKETDSRLLKTSETLKVFKKSGRGKFRTVSCRGCGEDFLTNLSRHWTCTNCSENRSLKTRVYRYGKSGKKIKELLEERNGLCVLCDRMGKCIDHDHKTNIARGFLCYGCNLALGRIEEDGWPEKVQEYLKRGQVDATKT